MMYKSSERKKIPVVKPMGRMILAISACIVIMSPYSSAQEKIPLLIDTARLKTIPLDKIPAAAGETTLRISRMDKSLIPDEKINIYKATGDSLTTLTDSLLALQSESDITELNNRYLKNLRHFWIDHMTQLQKEKERMTLSVKLLSEKQKWLDDQYEIWNKTRARAYIRDTASAINNIIDDLTTRINRVRGLVINKSIDIVMTLNKLTYCEIEIDDLLNRINNIFILRQAEILSKSNPALWDIDHSVRSNWAFSENLLLFYRTDILLVKRYFRNHEMLFLTYSIFLVSLILLFLYLNKFIARLDNELTDPFEIIVARIISRPVSAALIIGLFSSILIFPNHPLVFIDLAILLVSIPLIMIVSTIGGRFRYAYNYLFGLILILRFFNYIFLPDSLIHRYIFLIMGTAELFFLTGLSSYIQNREMKNKLLQGFIHIILVLYIIFTVIGMAGNLFGNVLMADQLLYMVTSNVFTGFLFFVSALILIGLIRFALDGNYLRKMHFIRNNEKYLKKTTAGWIVFAAALIWLGSNLRSAGIDYRVTELIGQLISHEYGTGSNTFTIGSILLFFIVIWLSVVLSKIVRVVLQDDILVRLPLQKGVPRLIAVMTRYTLIIIGIFIAVRIAGMSMSSITIIISAFGVGIGFGLQNIFNNLVSGLILLFERPIQIGDVVEVGSLVGHVKSMGIRSSNLLTFDGAEVIVPNGHLISNEVINWTLSNKCRRIEIITGVAYGSDVHKVQELFIKILNDHPDILKEPKPNVFFNQMGNSSLDFRLLFWIDNFEEWLRIRSEVIFIIHDVLKAEGIVIPFPQRDLHIRSLKGFPDMNNKGK